MELKFKEDDELWYVDKFQSYLYGIEIADYTAHGSTQRQFQSYLYGIEIKVFKMLFLLC